MMVLKNDQSIDNGCGQEADIVILREKCCMKCKYFEKRTCFCRYNPPIPVVMYDKNGQQFVTSVYSKVNMPSIDWCQKFDAS